MLNNLTLILQNEGQIVQHYCAPSKCAANAS